MFPCNAGRLNNGWQAVSLLSVGGRTAAVGTQAITVANERHQVLLMVRKCCTGDIGFAGRVARIERWLSFTEKETHVATLRPAPRKVQAKLRRETIDSSLRDRPQWGSGE